MNVSYAPDVFGGQRRQIEANAALTDYQRFELEATYLTLTSNVVTAAIQEASLRGQIEATQEIIKAESDQLKVVRNQFEAGAANRADVLTQESEVATTEATLPPLRKQLEQQHHVLLALIGHFPNEARQDHLMLASFRLPTSLPVSLPSQLVQQRPDVRAAQAQLQQASAQIGVAIANRLPQFSLTASYGNAAVTAATLFTPGHRDLDTRGGRNTADFPRIYAVASGTRGQSRLRRGRRPISQYGAHGLPECRRRAPRAAIGRGDAQSAAARRPCRLRHVRSHARPVPARRHHLHHPAQRPAELISRRCLLWCRRKPRATPTPPPCLPRWAAAGGIASTSRPIRTVPSRKSSKPRAIRRRPLIGVK